MRQLKYAVRQAYLRVLDPCSFNNEVWDQYWLEGRNFMEDSYYDDKFGFDSFSTCSFMRHQHDFLTDVENATVDPL